jgi:Pycsar effector protein
MRIDKDQLELAQYILERNLHWIGAAEVKTGVIVAVDTAMLGALAAAFSVVQSTGRAGWTNLFSFTAAAFLLFALFCAAMSVLPRTDGPPSSFVFFGKIVKREAADYADAFRRADTDTLLKDFLDQIHRNAQIACDKFRWVRNAMLWSFAALIPWVIAIGRLSKAFAT